MIVTAKSPEDSVETGSPGDFFVRTIDISLPQATRPEWADCAYKPVRQQRVNISGGAE
jgi:hypothetical protein